MLLTLRMIRVGDDPSAQGYARAVQRSCKRAGVRAVLDELPGDSTTEDVVEHVQALNADASVDGVLLGFPLAGQVDDAAIVDVHRSGQRRGPADDGRNRRAVCRAYDDGAGDGGGGDRVAGLLRGTNRGSRGWSWLGRSNVVGKPLWAMLLARNATTTVCHSRTVDLPSVTSKAEILVVAAGSPGLIGAEHVGGETVVVDVGTTYRNGTVLGDVDFDAVAVERARAVTPVPGGIGPITNYCLMRNLVELVERRSHSPENP